jgi:GNAT superfamily N-acetyltransferase
MFTRQPKPHLEDDCPPVVIIEPYQDIHHDGLLELLKFRYDEVGAPFDRARIDQQLEDIPFDWVRKGGNFMVATVNNQVVGSLAVRKLDEPHRAEFDWFYMDPAYEGKGYSAPFYRWALDWCVRQSIDTVELWSGQACKSAHHLYRGIGFVHNGVKALKKRPFGDYYLLYFELQVTPALISRLQRRFDRLP